MLYAIMLLIVIVVIVLGMLLGASVATFIDVPSLLLITLISIPIMVMSGTMKDFLRGFKMTLQNQDDYLLLDSEKALLAHELFGKVILLAGGIGTVLGVVSMLSRLDEPSKIGPSFAVAILTFFYAVLVSIVTLPIKTRLKAIILEKKSR